MNNEEGDIVLSEKTLVSSASLGRLWLTKKCVESGIPVNAQKGKPLLCAVKNGRTSVVSYLLEHGGDANIPELLNIACSKGFPRIVDLLFKYGCRADLEIALTRSILSGHTSCVKLLIENGVDIHNGEDFPLVEACRQKHLPIIKLLISKGADVNTKDGLPMITAAEQGDSEVVEILAKSGADVSINNDQPLRVAARNNQILTVIYLLNNGADRNILPDLGLDDNTVAVIKSFTKTAVIKRLRKAIHDSFIKQDFMWQTYCKQISQDNVHLIRKQATLLGINEPETKGKRCLCAELAQDLERNMEQKPTFHSDAVDMSGTSINDLPYWKIMIIEDTPFNCFDLFKMLKNGIVTNPYTRNPLPIKTIKERENLLRKVLLKVRFTDQNILEAVAQTPVATPLQLLRKKLEEEVLDKFMYAPDSSLILDATDYIIDEMLSKLIVICKKKSVFEILSLMHTPDIYPMLTPTVEWSINDATGFNKKRLFIDLLATMTNKKDEHTETRRVSITIMLRYFADRNNVEDDYAFMLGDDFSDGDLDDLHQLLIWDFNDDDHPL